MAAIDLSIIGKLEEAIETLTFRNEASVKIRKIKREKAFSQSIDIIIKSVSYNLYENFKAKPPIQFYGYATLVMQDCTEISIPIVSARQRLYYGFQYEAFRQWRHWIEFYQLYQLHRFNDISLASIMGALEIPYEEKKPQLKQNGWIELPIREVYIKLQDGTQFELEFSQWQPVKFTDPINNVEIDGKSKQDDGDKDSGLPKNGIQPKKNAPSNPFGGNPSTSSLENAGIKGFDLVDSSLLSSIDPDNLPPPVVIQYGAEIRWQQDCRPNGVAAELVVYVSGDIIQSDLITFEFIAGIPQCFNSRVLRATNNRTGANYTAGDGSGGFYTVNGTAPAVFYFPLPDPRIP